MNKTKTFIFKTLAYAMSLGVSAAMSLTLVNDKNIIHSSAESNDALQEYVYGDEPIDYFSEPLNTSMFMNDSALRVELPDSVDLSMTPYFPSINNQMGMGSCVAWATTYYQFTYEANKLNGIATTEDNAYSPAWIFNLWNGGENKGSVNTVAYDLLKTHGAVHMSDAPYRSTNGSTYINGNNFDYSWCTDTTAMIDALQTRLTGHDVVTIPSSGTPIRNNNSEALNEVKELLYGTDGTDGKVLNIRVKIGDNWLYKNRKVYDSATGTSTNYHNPETGASEDVAYCAVDGGGGHAMTVVGYDDNVWCDINNNNVVDEAELGAFKVANSWGEDYGNDGYIWVSYDALNRVSAVPDVESSNNRISIFDRDININGNGPANGFYYIDVANYNVYYVGQLALNTDYRNSFSLSAGRAENGNTSTIYSSKYSSNSPYLKNISHTGTLVFDYDDLCYPIDEYISGYDWYVRLFGNHNSATFKITDNLSNTIVDFGNISNGSNYRPISLSMGDLNYDGVVNDYDYDILNNNELSNLQRFLATDMPTPPTPSQDYSIEYNVTGDWGTGQNITIEITNNGNEPIRGWALKCNNFEGEIDRDNMWNCKLVGDTIIINKLYNSDIAVGETIRFGYNLNNPTRNEPEFTLCTFRNKVSDGYSVSFSSVPNWENSFFGYITITNTTDEPIMAWELTFTADNFENIESNQFIEVSSIGNTYTITGTYNGNIPIPANSSITMQFSADKTTDTEPSISNISLTKMVY